MRGKYSCSAFRWVAFSSNSILSLLMDGLAVCFSAGGAWTGTPPPPPPPPPPPAAHRTDDTFRSIPGIRGILGMLCAWPPPERPAEFDSIRIGFDADESGTLCGTKERRDATRHEIVGENIVISNNSNNNNNNNNNDDNGAEEDESARRPAPTEPSGKSSLALEPAPARNRPPTFSSTPKTTAKKKEN